MYDAIVIGGGLLGFSTAYHLVRGGARVLLVDRGDPAIVFALGERLDRAITRATGNARLLATLESIHVQDKRIRRMAAFSKERLRQAGEEHRKIIAAILAHDEDAAERLAREHIAHSADSKVRDVVIRAAPSTNGASGDGGYRPTGTA